MQIKERAGRDLKGLEKNIKIFVVDDHPIVSEGLEMLFTREDDLKLCGMAESATEALKQIEANEPDLAIIDITLKGGGNGVDLIKILHERYPQIKILVLSMHDEALYAERAFKAGASGYVKKEELTNAIIRAIRSVMGGYFFLSDNISPEFIDRLIFEKIDTKKRGALLTPREIDVLELIGHGYKTVDVAKKLNLSARTVDTHRQNIRKKLNLNSSAEMIKYAVEWVNKTN